MSVMATESAETVACSRCGTVRPLNEMTDDGLYQLCGNVDRIYESRAEHDAYKSAVIACEIRFRELTEPVDVEDGEQCPGCLRFTYDPHAGKCAGCGHTMRAEAVDLEDDIFDGDGEDLGELYDDELAAAEAEDADPDDEVTGVPA